MRESITMSISVPPRFKKKLTDAAKKLNIPRSVLIRKAVVDYLKTKPNKGDFKREF